MRQLEEKMQRQQDTGDYAGEPDDSRLIERTCNGDLAAFDTLVERYQDRVYGYTCRMLGDPETAREVTQDIFLRVYRYLDRFRGDSKFSTWLYTIVSSTCKNALSYYGLRAKHRADDRPANDIDGERTSLLDRIPDKTLSPDVVAGRSDIQAMVREAISKLPEHYRQVIILKDINGFSYDEISRIVDCKVGTVKSRLARARLIAREELTKAGLAGPEG